MILLERESRRDDVGVRFRIVFVAKSFREFRRGIPRAGAGSPETNTPLRMLVDQPNFLGGNLLNE